jgi:hypothetical protein
MAKPPKGVNDSERREIGLPSRPFMYTLDQIASLISLPESTLSQQYIFFNGRSTGVRHPYLMTAVNIAPREEGAAPQWRVLETEFIRWLRNRGFELYDYPRLRR